MTLPSLSTSFILSSRLKSLITWLPMLSLIESVMLHSLKSWFSWFSRFSKSCHSLFGFRFYGCKFKLLLSYTSMISGSFFISTNEKLFSEFFWSTSRLCLSTAEMASIIFLWLADYPVQLRDNGKYSSSICCCFFLTST